MGKQWNADISITPDMVKALLSSQFPALHDADIKALDAGWDNAVFLVQKTYVFRFPRRKVAVELLEMENRLLPWLATQLPLPIPTPSFNGVPTDEYPFPFSGYLIIEGNAPHKVQLTETERGHAAEELALFLRALHALPVDTAVEQGISPSDQIGRMNMQKRLPMFLDKVQEAHDKGLIDIREASQETVREVQNTEPQTEAHHTVVHGDLNFRNFLVDHGGHITGVIDWGDAHIGHPSIDLATAYAYLPPTSREQFWAAYGEVHPDMKLLAKFRALYTNILIMLYAHDIGDSKQFHEAAWAILNALREA